jgi:predicted extracellular nuclease
MKLTVGWSVSILGAALVPICQVQGGGFTSLLEGTSVQVQGVFSADFDDTSIKGFFQQDADCGNDPATSDEIFDYIRE